MFIKYHLIPVLTDLSTIWIRNLAKEIHVDSKWPSALG
jgi:hypothetical protein